MGEQSAKSIERTHLAGALEDAGETPLRLLGDEASGSLRVNLWVWNSSSLQWQRMTQPVVEIDLSLLEALQAGTHWQDQRFAYSSNNLIYRGLNTTHGAATDAASWSIWKYSYDANENVSRVEGPLTGAWDSRAALGWD